MSAFTHRFSAVCSSLSPPHHICMRGGVNENNILNVFIEDSNFDYDYQDAQPYQFFSNWLWYFYRDDLICNPHIELYQAIDLETTLRLSQGPSNTIYVCIGQSRPL